MVKHIQIVSWNANGLSNKIPELIHYLNHNNIDIIFIHELKFRQDQTLRIRGYQSYIQLRPNSRFGGVGVLVRDGLPHMHIKSLHTSTIEHIIITLQDNTTLIGVYNAPSKNFTEACLAKLLNMSGKVVLIGDLNARHTEWNCHISNKNGRTLSDFLKKHLYCSLLYTNEHTHFPDNNMRATTIDIAITKNITNISPLTVTADLTSDHNPIHLKLYNIPNQATTRTTTTYKDANWALYRTYINKNLEMHSAIEDTATLEEVLKSFTTLVQSAKKKVARTVKVSRKEQLPQAIITLIQDRNKFRKRWQKFGRQTDRQITKQLTYRIKNEIREHRQNEWTKKLTDLDPQDNSLWKMSKVLRKKFEQMPSFKVNNKSYFTDSDKAELLASNFQEIHNIEKSFLPTHHHIENKIRTELESESSIPSKDRRWLLTTPGEVAAVIKRLSTNKAPGSDGLHNILLKNFPQKAVVQFMYIINAIITLQHWPTLWKKAQVVPIKKVGKDPTDFKSYRPISLLSALSKTAERLILKRLNQISKKLDSPDPYQFGFKEKHSTTQQVARITTDITNAYKKKNVTVLVGLDIEKAFDRVWQEGLLYKMHTAGYPLYITKLISTYLNNRTMFVKINNNTSTDKLVMAGVPQGSVLGPKLFTIYIQDIPQFPNTKLALFADDTAIYARSHYAQAANHLLQCHISKIEEHFKIWKIKINAQKTEQVIFSRKFTNTRIMTPLKISGAEVKPQATIKYLGVNMDKRLTYQVHLKELLKKGYTACRLLYPLLKNNSHLSQNNKKLIYTSIIRPIITYAAPVWGGISKTAIKPLQVFQNKMLRLITNKGRYEKIDSLHNLTELETVTDFITRQSTKFYYNTTNNSNKLIKDITKYREHNVTNNKHRLPYQHLPIFRE